MRKIKINTEIFIYLAFVKTLSKELVETMIKHYESVPNELSIITFEFCGGKINVPGIDIINKFIIQISFVVLSS